MFLTPGYLKGQTDFPGDELFPGIKDDRVSHLLALTVPLNLAIQSWGLPGLCMSIVWPDSVHLDTRDTI